MNNLKFIAQINTLSSQSTQLCYHCHKCTAGCPVAVDMQYGPDRILRMVQLGEKERLFASHDIWLCASCETCGARCPNGIDIARVMDALRMQALAAGVGIAEPDAIKFHRLFLMVVQHMGRMHEASMLVAFKLWTRNLVSDMGSGIKMFFMGKVPLMPQVIKKRNDVKRIFKDTLVIKNG
jgi:heterodisulfide reductase subunit C